MSNKVKLPKLPVANLTQPVTGAVWTQPSTGSMHAVKQLHKTLQKGGPRKRKPLPGGSKLQPLYKNHTGPPPVTTAPFGPKVLPNIATPITDQDALIKHVASGELQHLPEPSKTTVRVFLASNYEDMKAERNMLLTVAVPQIEEFASSLGLHFQLVDLYWGVEQAMIDSDLAIRSVHQREITDCQRLSLGPNFVALLGDKYGMVPVITEIPEKEFDTIYNIATEKELQGSDMFELNFCKDVNSNPPVYRIHNITEEFDAVRLRDVIWQCVQLACKDNKMTEDQKKKYFTSSIDDDVKQGIIETKDPRRHCFCYRREFQNFRPLIQTPGIADFFDVTQIGDKTTLNTGLHKASLRVADDVNKHLGAGNFKPYYIPWDEEGMSVNHPDFQRYLGRLGKDFVRDINAMISHHAEKLMKGSRKEENKTLQEVIFHSEKCKRLAHNFKGQATILSRVERFLRDPRVNNKPFVIYGESGSGKSATMAKIASELKNWFSHESVVAYRALGSTSHSSSIFQTVISITNQISLAYGLELPDINTDCATLYKSLATFRRVLQEVSESYAFMRPLYILLDGIHSLQPQDEAMRAMWAIRDMAPNVHIIISTVSQLGNINLITGLVQLVSDLESSIEMEKLSVDDARMLIKADFDDTGRRLIKEQENLIIENFEKFPQPLLLRSTISQALEWGSFLKRSETGATLAAEEYLSHALDELEEQYGDLLIMSMVSYITTAPVGLHERELVDLLLADQDVEDEMQKFPNCVVNGVRYLPPYIIANIKFKLRNFMEDRMAEGKRVLAWSHRQFYEAVAQKYQVIYQGINEDKITDNSTSYTLLLHETMVNMYLKDHLRMTMSAVDAKATGKNSIPLNHPQPVNVHNHMKLERVPIHLRVMTPVEGLSRAKEAMLFNFDWLLTKLKAKPMHHLLNDFMSIMLISHHVAQQENSDKFDEQTDMAILYEFLQMTQSALNRDPDNLVAELLARLPGFAEKYEWIGKLLGGVNIHLNQQVSSAMVPLFPCFKAPQGLLRHTMEGPTHVLGFLQQGKTTVMFSQAHGTDVWLNNTGELMHRFPVNPEQRLDKVIAGHQTEFIMVGHYSHLKHNMDLSIISSETGVRLVHSIFPKNFEAIALNEKDNLLVVSTLMGEVQNGDERSNPETLSKCILGVDVRTKEVLYTVPAEDIHEEGVTKLMFVPGGDDENTYLLTIGSKRSKDLGFWHLQKQCLEFKMLLNVFVEHVQVHGSTAICGSARHGVLLFIDLNEGKVLKRIDEGDLVDMADMVVCHDGQHVAVATAEMGVNVYSQDKAAVSKCVGERAESHNGRRLVPTKLCMDGDEHFLFVGYETGEIIAYFILTGQTVVRLEGSEAHTDRVNSLRLSDDYMLFSAGKDHVAKMWNLADTLSQFSSRVQSLQGKLDGVQQFTEELNEVTVDSLQTEPKFPGNRDNISDFIITPDQKHLITSSYDGPIKVLDLESGKLVRSIENGFENGLSKLYLACKGTLLVGHCKEVGVPTADSLRVWKLATGEALKMETETGGALLVYSSCLMPGEQKVLTVSPSTDNRQAGMVFIIFDLFELKTIASLQCSILGSMDCSNLKFIGATRHEMFKRPPSRPVHTSTTQSEQAKYAELKEEEDREPVILAVLDYYPDDSTSYFFSLRIGGKNFDEINMDSSEPIHVDSKSPNCSLLLKGGRCVTGTINGSLLIWDAADQRKLDNLYDRDMYKEAKSQGKRGRPAHAGSVTCLLLSDDTTLMLSGAMDGQVKAWHLESKMLIKTVQVHDSPVTCMSLSGNNEILITGSDDPEVRMSVLNPRARQTECSFYTYSRTHRLQLTRDCSKIVLITNPSNPKLILLRTVHV